ncbi:glutathione transferase omega-1 [Dendryphion nanum]|uniref:Glutathione transferase omega-1 n=1 Tax=Dendryphion nanum TaxID=256645 RepID=A0A9P9EI52_9PLEO|nr:glutathione transferase omega-1 [Dendryphion nanum]
MSQSAHPDAGVHPVATGLAATTAQSHQEPSALKFYTGWFCPFAQRVWLALLEKRIPHQYIEVNPYHKPAALLALNPRGLVPTLEYDSKPLYESAVLVQFLDEAFPDHAPRLMPEDVYERARARIWIDFVGSRLIPAFHRFLQFQGGAEGLDEKRREFRGYIRDFVNAMHASGPYFAGAEFGVVDLIVVPWAVRLWVFDHFKGGLGIPGPGLGGEEERVWERWRVWYEAVSRRDSVRNTTSEREHYLPIYERYAEDKAMSELAKATREGRGVP